MTLAVLYYRFDLWLRVSSSIVVDSLIAGREPMEDQDSSAIQSQIGFSDRFKAWLDQIAVPDHPCEPALPDDVAADTMLTSFGVQGA